MTARGDTVLLTGATGFVGSHVCTALLEHGYAVRALVRNHRGETPRLPPEVEQITGDVRRSGELVPALRGCRYLVHTAALYSFAPRERAAIQDINVRGTRGLLAAARIAGVERAVVTSSSATVGPASGETPATEDAWAATDHETSAYHASKLAQEREVLAARIPAVLLLPTAPIGPADRRPTPTGRMLLDVMRGRMWATLGGGMNVVDVRDVAEAHVAALRRGRPGERYLVGARNLTLGELFTAIARAAGRRGPWLRLPYVVALAAGVVDEARGRLLGGEPAVPLEGVRMARRRMYVSSAKAERELEFRPHAIEPAIDAAVEWYRRYGYAA
jgi:dihydroflavonol-4-reductase